VATEFAGPYPGRLQHLECATGEGLPLQGLEELKTRLIDEWARLDQSIVDADVG